MPDTVEYRGREAPPPGQALEVAPGVHWPRMPLPFRLNHINLWLLEDGDGWVIVDTGLFDPETTAPWGGVFETTLARHPVRRIVVTHFHPDRVGMAGRPCDRLGIGIWMIQAEWLWATSIDTVPAARLSLLIARGSMRRTARRRIRV